MSKIYTQIGNRSMRFWIVAAWCAFYAICAQARIDPQAEKGDAVFRDLFKAGINVGHTAIYYAYYAYTADNQYIHMVIQASGTGSDTPYAVAFRPFDYESYPPTFMNGLEESAYWGAGNRSTLSPATWDGSANSMTAARRDAIITEAQQLIGTAYCWYWGIWEDSYGNDGSVSCEPRSTYPIYPSYIRCDGVVQWVYERVGFNMGNRTIDLLASPYPSDRAGRFYVAYVDPPSTTLQDNGTTYKITTADNSSTPAFVNLVYPDGSTSNKVSSPDTESKNKYGTTYYYGVDFAGHSESWKSFTYWQVTASAGSGGSISPSGSVVKNNGTSQTFTASPTANYVVNQWLVDGSVVQNGSNSYTLSNITTSRSVQVTFGCTLTVNNGTGGGTYMKGSPVLIEANTPADGKYFDRWTGSILYVANVTSATTTVTMPAANIAVTATYKDILYALTVNGGTGSGFYTNGQKVTITATVPVGLKFDRWNDGNINASRVITMVPEPVTYTASFIDIQNPILTLSSPATGLRLTNSAVTLTGKATDNCGAADVLIQLNGGSWEINNVSLNTTNWTANLILQPGSNSVKVCAIDATGNSSATKALTLTYVVPGTLTIRTNGLGTVARAPATAPEVGATYTLTATPGVGSGFASWTGDASSTNKVLTFTMTTNKTLTANFTDIAKPTVAITLPTAALRILSNSTYTVKGTATDNGVVTGVFCRVNSGDWTPASTTNVWKSWSIPLTLTAGSNLIQAYSSDSAGNISATSSVSCTYVVPGILTVTTNGVGTITRAPATPPEVNQKYTLTAAAGVGSVFSNWTGDVTSTNKVITFTMTSNTVICANFTDTAKPTIVITAPTALQRIVTNGLIAVRGTAIDNKAVSDVLVQVNGGSWIDTATTNIWKNWSAEVTVSARTNTIRAYSMDTTGNCSTTSSVTFIYVEMGNLTIQTNGQGSVTRAPATTPELGAKYTMTATPKAGSVFTNWTYGIGGDVATNKPAITFTMPSNLVLTANFVDTAKPTVAITYPTASIRVVTNGLVILRGTAADNSGLNGVKYQLRTGEWTNAVSTNVWKNWTAEYIPATGLNTAKVYSVDVQGNISATSTVVFTYVPGAIMQVQTNGNGTVAPSYNGRVLEIGKSYTMTATAKAGNLFTNWTFGLSGPVATNKAAITFVMQTNLILTANFRSTLTMPDVATVTYAEITVDGSTADWTYVPRTSFSYASVTQEVATALSGNNIALLLSGCPFSTSDTVLVYFKLRLNYSSGDARHSVDLWTSGSALYGMIDGQVITGFESILLNGVLEVKFPVEQAPAQVTIEEVGCAMDTGDGTITELFRITP